MPDLAIKAPSPESQAEWLRISHVDSLGHEDATVGSGRASILGAGYCVRAASRQTTMRGPDQSRRPSEDSLPLRTMLVAVLLSGLLGHATTPSPSAVSLGGPVHARGGSARAHLRPGVRVSGIYHMYNGAGPPSVIHRAGMFHLILILQCSHSLTFLDPDHAARHSCPQLSVWGPWSEGPGIVSGSSECGRVPADIIRSTAGQPPRELAAREGYRLQVPGLPGAFALTTTPSGPSAASIFSLATTPRSQC
ncbi:uncharacterized protein MAM_04997 [Metarhizium album ARSEF 1941]|uniref:Uncharacterized protein n=1 Tax=Metarhizium album (strain ARSEF 1941) TaxID=1081103 RepID=A0A0B2WX01_METAS|nr:uncharacterized protein MAM_04997 [Metarhizium album ARSEF 1941]KHN97400.1 hypothetical protein MAM_04997 [Metarhizium album ARSEF 1941]